MVGLGGWYCFEEGLFHLLVVGSFAGFVVDLAVVDLAMNLTSLVGFAVLLSLVGFR